MGQSKINLRALRNFQTTVIPRLSLRCLIKISNCKNARNACMICRNTHKISKENIIYIYIYIVKYVVE